IFLFFKNGEGKSEDFHISTNTYDRAKLNSTFASELNIPSGVIYFSDSVDEIAFFMAAWERLFTARSYSRYLLAEEYFRNAKGEKARMLVLFYLERMEWNNPKVMGGHLKVTDETLITDEDIEHICEKLSDIVGEKILPIKSITN
ncbi:hypothetical protein N9W79_02580, partial [bacterium]|nr:hypothetical protein [bacterium]